MTRPMLFLLHALGSSARAWAPVIAALGDAHDCVALDLPGFGDAAADARTGVEAMVDYLADEVRARAPATWIVVGHSLGGKLATLIAARARDGEAGLSGLAGVILLAGSPPAPEPIEDARRAQMLGWFATGTADEAQAREFVGANLAAPLAEAAMAQAVADVRRCGRHAWLAWLERGSREDWSARAGTISLPALIVAGSEDGDLGEANQRKLNLPHYPQGRIAVVADAAHLLPLEQPAAVARLIADFAAAAAPRALPPRFAATLASDRVTARTRRVMLARIDPPALKGEGLDAAQRRVLALLAERILPGADSMLAARMEAMLSGEGDGWRFAALPDDLTAWRRGLDTLAAAGFADLDAAAADAMLHAIAAGEGPAGALDAAQLRLWFEDVRAAAVRAWLSQPRAMARIGWDGFANGGDGLRPQGYQRTAADDLEPWQPRYVPAAEGVGR